MGSRCGETGKRAGVTSRGVGFSGPSPLPGSRPGAGIPFPPRRTNAAFLALRQPDQGVTPTHRISVNALVGARYVSTVGKRRQGLRCQPSSKRLSGCRANGSTGAVTAVERSTSWLGSRTTGRGSRDGRSGTDSVRSRSAGRAARDSNRPR